MHLNAQETYFWGHCIFMHIYAYFNIFKHKNICAYKYIYMHILKMHLLGLDSDAVWRKAAYMTVATRLVTGLSTLSSTLSYSWPEICCIFFGISKGACMELSHRLCMLNFAYLCMFCWILHICICFVHIYAKLCIWYVCIYVHIFLHISAYLSLLCTYIGYLLFAYLYNSWHFLHIW